MITDETEKKILLLLLKNCFRRHTITSTAKNLKLSRVGIWKAIKKLEAEKYVNLENAGEGKTSAYLISINWDNVLAEKILSFYIMEESFKYPRWIYNFKELKNEADFVILFGSIIYYSEKADDIDIINITDKKKFIKIQKILDKIQKTQDKKIHSINFTESEFIYELQRNNKAFIEAIKKGIILYGHDKFINFIKNLNKK